MQTTVTLDDALYETARAMADPDMDEADLFRVAIETFIQVRTARRLAALGGSTPDLIEIRRRRDEPDTL